MKHSQQPSIDILTKSEEVFRKKSQEMINEDYDPDEINEVQNIWFEISKIRKEIEALPQEPTTDELLEEMKNSIISLQYDSNTKLWSADWNDECMYYLDWYWKTPREALIALKEKLSDNSGKKEMLT